MKRLLVLLLALVAAFSLSITPAAADDGDKDGIVGGGVEVTCDIGLGSIMDTFTDHAGSDLCDDIGDAVAKKMDDAWKAVWDSVLGDIINSAADVLKWVIKKVLTVALLGPSLDLEATGLFGRDATLAGMLTWLGLVIATFGAMWQLGKMAVTGQMKYAGQAAVGWVQNMIISVVGVGLVAILLAAGDAMTTGLVDATFEDDGEAYERIISTLVPNGISNPITMLGIVVVLLLVGFIQLIMVFLRQSVIPIQCLLLPVAGGGRVGGDVTRQWAPRLITSICVVIAYKPMLAIIICTGFAEFGHATTLAEWLRGCATLILAVLAPGPLTRVFAPFGEAVGAGLAAGGAMGAVSSAAGLVAGRASKGDDAAGGAGAQPATPVEHAQYVEQVMRGNNAASGEDGAAGGDARAHAARTDTRRLPGQAAADPAATAAPGTPGTPGTPGAAGGAGSDAGAATGRGAASGAGAGIAIQVLDGVNDTIQGASRTIGDGGNPR
jgi:hypothetical protein